MLHATYRCLAFDAARSGGPVEEAGGRLPRRCRRRRRRRAGVILLEPSEQILVNSRVGDPTDDGPHSQTRPCVRHSCVCLCISRETNYSSLCSFLFSFVSQLSCLLVFGLSFLSEILR